MEIYKRLNIKKDNQSIEIYIFLCNACKLFRNFFESGNELENDVIGYKFKEEIKEEIKTINKIKFPKIYAKYRNNNDIKQLLETLMNMKYQEPKMSIYDLMEILEIYLPENKTFNNTNLDVHKKPEKKYIAFYHASENYLDLFSSKEDTRPTFYWFNDRFFHIFQDPDYFMLFVKNPKLDKIKFRARHEGLDFNGLYEHYEVYKSGKISEPSILMSFSDIVPSLIAKKIGDCYKIIKPEEFKDKIFSLRDEKGNAIKFTEINLIKEIIPKIANAHPFIEPKKKEGEYIYDDWEPMITEKMGFWM